MTICEDCNNELVRWKNAYTWRCDYCAQAERLSILEKARDSRQKIGLCVKARSAKAIKDKENLNAKMALQDKQKDEAYLYSVSEEERTLLIRMRSPK